MYRFFTRSISALGDLLERTFVHLGNDPSIGWLSDDTFGWDLLYLYRDDVAPTTPLRSDSESVVAPTANSRQASPTLSNAMSAMESR